MWLRRHWVAMMDLEPKLDTGGASILSNTLKNADKADSMKEVMEVASDLGAQDAENLTAVFQNADKADDLKAVMDVAKETLGSDDGSGTKKLDSVVSISPTP